MNKLSIKEYTENASHTNKFATTVDWLGRKLTYFTSVLLEQGAKIGRPLKSGFQDQCNTNFKEICMRVLRVVFCILLAWTLVLGLVGGSMRLGASLARREITWVPLKDPPILEGKIREISIRTFNVGMMPEFISVINGLRPGSERIREIAEALVETGDDIVCLQELFHTEAAEYLTEKLRVKFPYMIYNVGTRSCGLNSGLMIASKFPIVDAEFWRHTHRSGVEHYSNKGSLAATIKPSADQTIIIFNSHLNAETSPSDAFPEGAKSYRESQISQLKEKIDTYIDQSVDESNPIVPAVFVAGDFNLGPLTPVEDENGVIIGAKPNGEWPTLKNLMDPFIADDDLSKTTYDIGRDSYTGWDKSRLDTWQMKPECLDHIGIPKTNKAIKQVHLLHRVIDPVKGSSDHLAVAAKFQILE